MPAQNPLDKMLDEACDQYGRAIWSKKNTRYKDRLSGIVFCIDALTELTHPVIMRYLQYRHSGPKTKNGKHLSLGDWLKVQQKEQEDK